MDNQQQQPSFFDDDDDSDSLSLRHLPIITTPTAKTGSHHHNNDNHSRRSSTSDDPTSDFFFEFLINNDDHLITSTADDVIFHGRLLPYAPPPPRRSLSLSSAVAHRFTRPQLTQSPSLPAIRPSRSLNYQSHHRHRSKPKPDKVPAKLPWYWLAFGLPVKMAAEMKLKDIKNRQFRREFAPPATGFLSSDRSCSWASWKFLRVLSCKSHATVDVNNTAPLRTTF